MPIYSYWNYSWSSLIYNQSGLGDAKSITQIALNCTNGPKTVTNQKIYMKHSSSDVFGSAAYEDPENSGYTLVFSGDLSFETGWNVITLDAPFAYNGTENLVVHWENRWENTYGPEFNSTASAINNNKNCGSDSEFPTTSGYLNPYPSTLTNMRFYYSSDGPATPTTPAPADQSENIAVDATLQWELGANTTAYDLFFGTNNQNLTKIVDNQSIASAGTFQYEFSELLDSCTHYYWQVVAKNGAETESSPVWHFKTQGTITRFPFFEGFETNAVFTPGWYGDSTSWSYPASPLSWSATENNVHTGLEAAVINLSDAGEYSLTTPRIVLPANQMLSFWWRNNTTTKIAGYDTTFVEISTDGGENWSELAALAPETATGYQKQVCDLSAFAGNNVFLRWRHVIAETGGNLPFYLDEISIENLNSNPQIEISPQNYAFREIFVSGKTYFDVQISNYGASELRISGANVPAPFSCQFTDTIQPGSSAMARIWFEGENPGELNETLTFEIAGTFSGNNTMPLSGTVLENNATLYESFDATPTDTLPLHWNKLRSTQPDQQFNTVRVFAGTSYEYHSAPNVVRMYNQNDSISPLMLITPGVNSFADNELSFYACKSWGDVQTVELIVGLMDDPYHAETFQTVQTIELTDTPTEYVISFDAANTKPYIALRHGQNRKVKSIYIDDVAWEEGTVSSAPNPAVVASPAHEAENVDIMNALKLQWASGGGSPDGYKLFFGSDNPPTNFVNGTDLSDQTSYPVSQSLDFDTEYFWKIVPYNSFGDAESCPVWSFTTQPDPTATLPYSESFENVTPTDAGLDFPQGWTLINQNEQFQSWDVIQNNATAPNNAYDGEKAMHVGFSFTQANDEWLISPPLQLSAGQSYNVSFWYKVAIYNDNGIPTHEKMEVKWGNDNTPSALIETIFQSDSIFTETYTQHSAQITPTSNGTYYIGFHAYSDALQYILFLDWVEVKQDASGIAPLAENPFRVYPNPSWGVFTLESQFEQARFEITDMLGRTLHSGKIVSPRQAIQTYNLKQGVYLLNVISGTERYVQKIMVR